MVTRKQCNSGEKPLREESKGFSLNHLLLLSSNKTLQSKYSTTQLHVSEEWKSVFVMCKYNTQNTLLDYEAYLSKELW